MLIRLSKRLLKMLLSSKSPEVKLKVKRVHKILFSLQHLYNESNKNQVPEIDYLFLVKDVKRIYNLSHLSNQM